MTVPFSYTKTVKEHFFNPKHTFSSEQEMKQYNKEADGVGQLGNPVCGDIMKFWIKVDKKTNKIIDCKWKTFGCVSAIASTSMLSEMILEKGGMKIQDALKITAKDILKRLGGLPVEKIHCSVLGDRALKAAVNNYLEKQKK